MLASFERSRLACAAVVLSGLGFVLTLVHGAAATGDAEFRRTMLWPDPPPALRLIEDPVASPVRHRHARRIWAAAASRPLRIGLDRRMKRSRWAPVHRARDIASTAIARAAAEPQVVFPRLIVLPKPPRPALVSIYQDRTLRTGDAVMMADGIHVFRGVGAGPHRPGDFVRLTFVAALDWHLRRTLDVLDRNPPTRWSSAAFPAG